MATWRSRLRPRILLHRLILRPVMRLIFGVSVDGRQHLQDLDRFILVANHNSHLDIFLLFQALHPDQLLTTHPVAAYDYFCRPRALLWLVTFLFEPVWVTRTEGSRDPLRGMREELARGHNLILFPEGTRGEAGQMAHFKAGIGQLATEFRVIPIVPAFLSGPERALPKEPAGSRSPVESNHLRASSAVHRHSKADHRRA